MELVIIKLTVEYVTKSTIILIILRDRRIWHDQYDVIFSNKSTDDA